MDEKERLQQHIDGLFENAPRSRAAYELRDELLTNSIERYEDLLKSGLGEEPAFQSVIDNIGDVDELIGALPDENRERDEMLRQESRERNAMVLTISVGLYILAGVVFFAGVALGEYLQSDVASVLGLAVAGLLCIVPTCMLVYNAATRPKYNKKDDTVVEDFKKWSDGSKKAKQVYKAASGLIWSICVLAYLLISFTTGAWGITWILFVATACIEAAINLLFKLWELK